MIEAPAGAPAPDTLVSRYGPSDLEVLDDRERKRFLGPLGHDGRAALQGDERAWRRIARHLAWELLYRIEPDLYERLVAAEPIHPAVIERLPRARRAVEIGAGTGRLTVELAGRCEELVAVEPAAPLRERLREKVRGVEVRGGFFDSIPVPDGWADLVVSCSAFTPEEAHGGERGLAEMDRVASPGGLVVLVWPNEVRWLTEKGFAYESFPGELQLEFESAAEAVAMAEIFYPHVAGEVARRGTATIPYELIGVNPPRDLAWKRVP